MSKEKKVFFAFAASQQKLYRLLNATTNKVPSQEVAKTAAKQKLTLHIHAG